MAEYIEREALIEQLKIHFDALYNDFDGKLLYSDHICIGDDVDALIDFVNKQPAADVAEVKHGEWREWHGDKMVAEDVYRHYHYNTCSVCYKGNAVKSNFCPNCGAKMDGGNHDR